METNVAVARVTSPSGAHTMSIISDGSTTEYVLPEGTSDRIFNSDRPKNFVAEFAEEYGREPVSASDWVITASYNLGWSGVGDPEEGEYESLADAYESERKALIAARRAILSESETNSSISDDVLEDSDASVSALFSDGGDEVVGLILLTAESEDTSSVFVREEGSWIGVPSETMSWDKLESLDVEDVSSDYVSVFDGGDRSIQTVEQYLAPREDNDV